MTIEFHCPHCDKLLKTPDDKAGVRANCPGCGEVVTVPDAARETSQADPSFGEVGAHSGVSPPVAGSAQADAGQARDPGSIGTRSSKTGSQYDMQPCPMCGAAIDKTEVRCRFCGETLSGPGASVRSRTNVDAGEVLSRAWEIYRTRLGALIGALVVMGGILSAIAVAGAVAVPLILAGIGLAGGGKVQPANIMLIFFGFFGLNFIVGVLFMVVFAWLQAGLHRLLLAMARGGDSAISALFSGAPFFWRFLWGTILFQIALTIGYFMCFIPGALLLLLFWPVYYVIVDRDVGIIDALRLTYELTAGNYLQVLVLFLASIGCQLLGALPGVCLWFLFKSEALASAGSCAGLLFTTPFWMILWPVTYCGISGQSTAQPA